jgi:hypothetical protein
MHEGAGGTSDRTFAPGPWNRCWLAELLLLLVSAADWSWRLPWVLWGAMDLAMAGTADVAPVLPLE